MEKIYKEYVNCNCIGLPRRNKPIEFYSKMREDKLVKKG